MEILINKYKIKAEPQIANLDPTTVTFHRIAYSFSKVILHFFNICLGGHAFFFRNNLFTACYDLPSHILSPVIVSVLPKLNDPPAILTAVALKLNDSYASGPSSNDMSDPSLKTLLTTIYHRVLISYNATVFPERFKLQLCKKWKIVVKMGNEYNFNPIFQEYRAKAKELISEARTGDSDLNDILKSIYSFFSLF